MSQSEGDYRDMMTKCGILNEILEQKRTWVLWFCSFGLWGSLLNMNPKMLLLTPLLRIKNRHDIHHDYQVTGSPNLSVRLNLPQRRSLEKSAELLQTFNSCQCEELEPWGTLRATPYPPVGSFLQSLHWVHSHHTPQARDRTKGLRNPPEAPKALLSSSPLKAGTGESWESPLRSTEPSLNTKQDEQRSSMTRKPKGRVQE